MCYNLIDIICVTYNLDGGDIKVAGSMTMHPTEYMEYVMLPDNVSLYPC